MASGPLLDHAPRESVRTFTARWRSRPLVEEQMATLLPGRAIPDGPLVPQEAFGRSGPVVVEIGSGHGAAAIAYAAEHPEADVVAVDVHVPGIARMLAAADEAEVANLWAYVGDALPLLRERVAPGSLDAVHLFFPDPWHKQRHAKRRFVQQHTLTLVASRLRPGGRLLVATDIDRYAEHTRRQLAAHGGFDVVEGVRPAWRPDDGFEAKGLRAGRTISEFRCTVS
ncbi:tRNA (guanosine(46)-N7)-methyltransferase TrmB [Nostocoides sp. Soil756]|uniref:tRNA (guanosine(46)-N7)-methyltransferase TrmB n=1 Tax=Nostocoides sp. Soil756 TaxID=1736399 RepID=UPI0006F7D45C|nr:tRNA (guanosine(46)-N7)-methyltransferase TrmB [Tetrasphaera sp. Soil756]KRE62417.1 SAM-dependent methyltransferase [Tetrasphaera sp. Soil756]